MANNPFHNLDFQDIPENLEIGISARIRKYESRQTLLKRSLSALSIVGFYFSVQYLLSEAAKSGFGEYLSILFSDTREVLSLIPDFAVLLLESLPVWGVFGCLICGAILVSSIRGLFRPLFR